ncbi:hypothetical protein P7C73_g6272, partial [Tremellales sp. Uapishka_1]
MQFVYFPDLTISGIGVLGPFDFLARPKASHNGSLAQTDIAGRMSEHQEILEEEFEVLESIFPDEIEKISENEIKIRIEPEEPISSQPLALKLVFNYPPTYPDVIPELSLEEIEDEGELREGEEANILEGLRSVAEESLGMAMTFTLTSAARESLSDIVRDRVVREKEEDDRKTREYEELEAKKKRGTPITTELFTSWRLNYMKELKSKRDKEEEERIKSLPPKEREEWRRRRERLSGRQLFESSQTLATSDEGLYEGGGEVDIAQYSREDREAERRKEEEEEERRRQGLVAADGDESD